MTAPAYAAPVAPAPAPKAEPIAPPKEKKAEESARPLEQGPATPAAAPKPADIPF